MQWIIEQVEADNYVKVTCKGIFSIREHSKCTKKLITSPFWKPGTKLIFDNRNFDLDKINLEQLRTASYHFQEANEQLGNSRVAMLMKSKHDFGIGRQFEMISEDKLQCKFCVFVDEREALNWLLKKAH